MIRNSLEIKRNGKKTAIQVLGRSNSKANDQRIGRLAHE
jgi:hypothetical protein